MPATDALSINHGRWVALKLNEAAQS